MTAASGKLLVYYADPGEAAAMRRRLRAAGVMVEVDSVDPHNMQPSKSGTQRIGLWVTFEDQFDDAVKLLQDPAHRPRRVINADETGDVGTTSARSSTGSIWCRKRWLMIAAGALCLLAGIVYIGLF